MKQRDLHVQEEFTGVCFQPQMEDFILKTGCFIRAVGPVGDADGSSESWNGGNIKAGMFPVVSVKLHSSP